MTATRERLTPFNTFDAQYVTLAMRRVETPAELDNAVAAYELLSLHEKVLYWADRTTFEMNRGDEFGAKMSFERWKAFAAELRAATPGPDGR